VLVAPAAGVAFGLAVLFGVDSALAVAAAFAAAVVALDALDVAVDEQSAA
jgi:hypothetical protein